MQDLFSFSFLFSNGYILIASFHLSLSLWVVFEGVKFSLPEAFEGLFFFKEKKNQKARRDFENVIEIMSGCSWVNLYKLFESWID